MSTRKLTGTDRSLIVAAVRDPADHRSRAQLARDFETSPRTVQRIVEAAGIADPWDTSATRAATAAAVDHLKARRAAVSEKFLQRADEILERAQGPWKVWAFGGKDNEFNSATLEDVPAADLRNLMAAAGLAFDKHLAADKHDATDQADDGISMIGRLAEGLDAAYRRLSGDEHDEPAADDDTGEGAP